MSSKGSRGSKSSSGSKSSIDVNKLIKIENMLPGNEYDKLLNIYLFVVKTIKDSRETDKFFHYLYYRDNYKLKRAIIDDYYTLSEKDQDKVKKQIFELNSVDNKQEIMRSLLLKLEFSAFSLPILMRFYFYLLKTNHENKLKRTSLTKKANEDAYSFLNNKDYFNFEEPPQSKQVIFGKIEIELRKMTVIDPSLDLLKELYYKVLLFLSVASMKVPNMPDIQLLFNYLFMDVELFLKKDPEMRIIGFGLMTANQPRLRIRLIHLMQLLLPSSNEDPDADEPANLVYYRILAYSYFGGMQNLEEIPRIASNFEAFKKFILKFLNEFYVKTLIYKSHSKITRENEMIVKQILEIIITIILDDGYTPQKYERELTYISDNFITPNFFYYYVVSLILSVKMEPQVVTYIRDFITNEIANMNDEPNSKRFQLSRSSSRRGLRRELARGSTLIETLTPQEQNRYMPRRLFTAEFVKRIANNPEQLRYTFLGLMKRFYKMRTSPPNNEEDDTGNTYLFEKAVHPLLSLS